MKKALILSLLFGLIAAIGLLAQAPKSKGDAKPKGDAAKPAKTEAPAADEVAVLETKLGKITIKFFPEKAPNHVKNFKDLCKSGFYDGTRFHRAIPGFMIQGGDPNTKTGDPSTWGKGGNVVNGKEVTLKSEFNDIHHTRGILSMARASDPNSASSQFFICVADAPSLDGQYTVFGQVIDGMDVVDKIVSAPKDPRGPDNPEGSRPATPVAITKAKVEKAPAKAAAKTAK